jgi:sigma-B regulation protein RsbU (phosphoserine phosphatase)
VILSEFDHIEEDFEDLYENAPCGYLSLRTDGRIAKSNQTFCRWIGYAPDELTGKRLHDLLNIAGRIFYETHFAPLLRMQGFFNEVALDLVKKDGEPFPVLVNAAERRNAEGKPLFIRLTVFNATDRRRYERELRKARDELKELTATLETRISQATADLLRSDTALTTYRQDAELREQFIAVLGHDLRNPLASVVAGMRLIQTSKLDDRAEAVVMLMQKAVLRMQGLIDNVLDFARGRLGGGLTLTLSDQPLEPTLRQVVDELQSTHPESNSARPRSTYPFVLKRTEEGEKGPRGGGAPAMLAGAVVGVGAWERAGSIGHRAVVRPVPVASPEVAGRSHPLHLQRAALRVVGELVVPGGKRAG